MSFDRLDAIVKARTPADRWVTQSGMCLDMNDADLAFFQTMRTLADLMLDVVKAADAFLDASSGEDINEGAALENALVTLRTACEALP